MKYYFLLLALSLLFSCNSIKQKPTLIKFSGKLLNAANQPLLSGNVKIFDGSRYLDSKKKAKQTPVLNSDGSFELSINLPEKEKDYQIHILHGKDGYLPQLCSRIIRLPAQPTIEDTHIKLDDVMLRPIKNVSHDHTSKKIKVYAKPNLETENKIFDTEEYVVLSSEVVDSNYNYQTYKNNHLIVAQGKWLKIICSKNMNDNSRETVYLFFNDALDYQQAIKCYEPFIEPVVTCQLYASADGSSSTIDKCEVSKTIGPLLASQVLYDTNLNLYWYKLELPRCTGWLKGDPTTFKNNLKHPCQNTEYLWTL